MSNMDSGRPASGVLLYDTPAMPHKGGWMCETGKEPRRFEQAREVSSAVVWMLNLNYQQMDRSNLLRSNKFREDQYLGKSRLFQIAQDFGFIRGTSPGEYAGVAGPEAATLVARLYGSTLEAAWRLGVSGFPPRVLGMGFRERYFSDFPQSPEIPELVEVFANATQFYTFAEHHVDPTGRITLSVYRDRYQHALEMTRHGLPVGQWRRVPLMSDEEIRNHARPLFLKVRVHSLDEEVGSLINFGGLNNRRFAGAQNDDARPREWLPLPEYILLSEHGNVEVLDILEADMYQVNPMHAALQEFSTRQRLAPGFQLCAEALWNVPRWNQYGKAARNAAAAYMVCMDRLIMLREALMLRRRAPEIVVGSMGIGRISFKVPDYGRERTAWLADLVRGTSLIPPMCHNLPHKNPGIALESPTQVLQSVALQGILDIPAEMDRQALEEWDHRTRAAA